MSQGCEGSFDIEAVASLTSNLGQVAPNLFKNGILMDMARHV